MRDFNESVSKLTDPIEPAFVRDFQHGTHRQTGSRRVHRARHSGERKLPARVWRDVLAGLLAADADDALDRIKADTLIIWGDKDAMWARLIRTRSPRGIRGSRLVTYEGIGHSPQWEDPTRFVQRSAWHS